MPFASAQVALQYFFPSAGIQLQAGCAHLDAAFIKAPFCYCARERVCTRTLQQTLTGASNRSGLFCSYLTKVWKSNSEATSMLPSFLWEQAVPITSNNSLPRHHRTILSTTAQLLASYRLILLTIVPVNDRYNVNLLDEKASRMRELGEHTIFLREQIMLPEGIALTGNCICKGWVVLQSGDAMWLDKAIRGLGWNSSVLTRTYWRSGYANRTQDAIHRAAQLALRKVDKRFNAAEIGHVTVAKHLWFYAARVGIFSRSIQESPFLGNCNELSTRHGSMTFESR